jgi:hypothetical protein
VKYRLVPNSCNCHPETCCCPDFRIIDENGNWVAGGMDKDQMKKLVDQANQKGN